MANLKLMCVYHNLTLRVVNENQDLRHLWYCMREYQTPLRGSFETHQGYRLHFVRFCELVRRF